MVELETPRLLITEFNAHRDAEAVYALNSDPEVLRYTGDDPFDSVEEGKQFLMKYDHYRLHGYGRWAVFLKSTHELLGWCGLKYHEHDPVDLGYRFMKKYWNLGYATESAHACTKYGFEQLNLPEIMVRIDPNNNASIAVAQKLGYQFWKIGTCEHVNDTRFYRMNQDQYQQLKETL